MFLTSDCTGSATDRLVPTVCEVADAAFTGYESTSCHRATSQTVTIGSRDALGQRSLGRVRRIPLQGWWSS
jgi:hypothetical protein